MTSHPQNTRPTRPLTPSNPNTVQADQANNMHETDACPSGMSFEECELAILRMAVDKATKKIKHRIVNSATVQQIVSIAEKFLRSRKLICYGGVAINNILPANDQFYDPTVDIPDYDFFSPNAIRDAKELADMYYRAGFIDVDAKSAVHVDTYKIFVNFMPIADITQLDPAIFNVLAKEAVSVNGILYAPPNFLRMAMYLELSRPAGDVSRWEKILKRLSLLNKHYPLANDVDCENVSFQRNMENKSATSIDQQLIYETVRNSFISQGVVFFGGYAISLYSRYMPRRFRQKVRKVADFDVLSLHPRQTAEKVQHALEKAGVSGVSISKHPAIGEVIPVHYEIRVADDTIAFIYEPLACHSYNKISLHGRKIRVATIDTMLSFYLAFLYTNRPYYNSFLERTLCMARFLFEVQQRNRLRQHGLLRRFSVSCYGHQKTREELREEKATMYRKLWRNPTSRKYQRWFLNYRPHLQQPGRAARHTRRQRRRRRPPQP